MCDLTIAKDLAVVAVVDIMKTEKEVGIRNGVHAIETAAGRGDDNTSHHCTILLSYTIHVVT